MTCRAIRASSDSSQLNKRTEQRSDDFGISTLGHFGRQVDTNLNGGGESFLGFLGRDTDEEGGPRAGIHATSTTAGGASCEHWGVYGIGFAVSVAIASPAMEN